MKAYIIVEYSGTDKERIIHSLFDTWEHAEDFLCDEYTHDERKEKGIEIKSVSSPI